MSRKSDVGFGGSGLGHHPIAGNHAVHVRRRQDVGRIVEVEGNQQILIFVAGLELPLPSRQLLMSNPLFRSSWC